MAQPRSGCFSANKSSGLEMVQFGQGWVETPILAPLLLLKAF